MTATKPKPDPYKTVLLTKVTDLAGTLPIGHVYTWTYKSYRLDENVRARKAFKRDHPLENPTDWKQT